MTVAETVRIRLVWVPAEPGGRRGRVVVERAVSSSGDGRAGESGAARIPLAYWMSEPTTPRHVLASESSAIPAAWRDLLLGRRVDDLPAPIPVHHAHRDGLEALAHDLEAADACDVAQRPLLLVTALLHESGSSTGAGLDGDAGLDGGAGTAGFASLHVIRFSGDVLSHAFDGVFAAPPDGLALARTTVSGIAASRYVALTATASDARISVDDVRAACSGPQTAIRVHRVLVHAEHTDAEVREVLRTPAVHAAIEAVQRDSPRTRAGRALVAALGQEGWPAEAEEVVLDVGAVVPEEVLRALDGLVVLGVGRGIDADGADRPHVSSVYLLPGSPGGSALLREHQRVAQIVAESTVPPQGYGLGDPRLGRELQAALGEVAPAPGNSAGGRMSIGAALLAGRRRQN